MQANQKYIPQFIYSVYTLREDLQLLFPLNEKWEILAFFLWWKEIGEVHEYNYFWLPSKKFRDLFLFSKNKNGLNNIHISICSRFKDLEFCNSLFNLRLPNCDDYNKYINWISVEYSLKLKYTYFLFPTLPGVDNIGSNNENICFGDDYLDIYEEINFLSILLEYSKLNDNQTKYSLNLNKILYENSTKVDSNKLPTIYRYFYEYLQSFPIAKSIDNIYSEYLNKKLSLNLSRFLFQIFNSREDLQKAFKKQNLSLENFLLNWWNNSGYKEYVRDNKYISLKSKDYKEFANEKIAVTGFHNYQLGISEDARNLYKSLKEITPSVKASNIPLYSSNKKVKVNYKIYDFVNSEYNFIVLPPLEQLQIFLHNPSYFYKNKVFALIPWELESLPKRFQDIFQKIDIVLAPSKFVKKAFSKIHNDVRLLPHFLDIEYEINEKRFDEFTFVYSADMNSHIARKNPLCVIKAFKMLIKEYFFKNQKKPKLLIRLTNFSSLKHSDIVKEIDNCEQIFVLTEKLDRKKYLTLLSKSHCYVSPHRSEGFGRNIAESMFLGTPTIVSNYSGNLDFCNNENSYLIDGKLIKINKGEYPGSDDCLWYDPDINHLKLLMMEVFSNYKEAISKSINAKVNIISNHSKEAYKKNLQIILGQDLYKII
tara:strand:+ start:5304 stop:7256 length:1953 start_codon:yes stop_codon:yes gene_type:complete